MERHHFDVLKEISDGKIEPEQIEILATLLDEDLSLQQLADRFGLTIAQVKHAIYDKETGVKGRLIQHFDRQGKRDVVIPKKPREWPAFLAEQGILPPRG